jgi:lipopolysaccharide biosynthesis glycosyltransferase
LSNCCICFTTNKNYLFPTVVAAIQARANSSRSLADVAVYCVEKPSQEIDDFAVVCASEGIDFVQVSPEVTENSHVAFSRLFLDRFVPQKYSQFLYIDGDTQIMSSLDPLISAEVPANRFLATTDPVAFEYDREERIPERYKTYLKRIGLSSTKDYFNSGVLRINRTGWADIGEEAYAFCLTTPKGELNFWDQDGLNVVAARSGVRLPMSLRYNFPVFLRNCRVEQQLKPVIYHFMSNPKPWNGSFPPWNRAATLPYRDLCRRYPSMSQHQPPFSTFKKAKYTLQQRIKQLNETINWGLSSRRGEVLSYEDMCRELPTLSA